MSRCFYWLLFIYTTAQTAYGQVSDLTWHSIGLREGLSETTNEFVYKDSRGYIWISALSGLNRYDGTSVRVFLPDASDPATLPDEKIQSLFFEDDRQDLWFSTFAALQRYDYRNDCFDSYQVMDTSGTPIPAYYVFHIDPDQHLWLLVAFEMVYTFHIPTGTFTFKGRIEPNSVRCFNITDENNYLKRMLIRGRDWSGIGVVDVHKDRTISPPFLLSDKEEMMVTSLRQIIPEGDSVYWILRPNTIVKYDAKTGNTTSFHHADPMDCMAWDSDGQLIIGSPSNGLYVFSTTRQQFIPTDGMNGPFNVMGQLLRINYITVDRDGNIWTSTDGIGLNFAQPRKKKFHHIRFTDDIPGSQEVKTVGLFEIAPDSILCFSEKNGAFLIESFPGKNRVTSYAPLAEINHQRISALCRDPEGSIWIMTWSGNIYVFDPQKKKLNQVSDSTLVGGSIMASDEGTIYFTTISPGFYKILQDDEGYAIHKVHEQFNGKTFYPLYIDHEGRFWLNHDLKAFEVYNPHSLEWIATIPLEGISNGIAESGDNQSMFIGTYNGLFEIDKVNLRLRKFHSEKNGFPATSIASVLSDDGGTVWIGHTKGIVSYDPSSGHTRKYNFEDGLPLTSYTRAACSLQDGRFCFGTIGGVTIFHPDMVHDIQTKANPHLSSLLLNDKLPAYPLKCASTGASNFEEIRKLILPYRDNTLSFTIHALEYGAPEENQLAFKMEGLDEELLMGHNGDLVRYPSMPPGSYRFIMYAFNADGIRNPDPRILDIVIHPPYYKTWWFLSLVALFSLTVIGYIFYLRFSKKLELQRVRLKLYENLHDDVGSRLTAIVLSAEDLERNENISHPQITSISQIARSIVGNMRRLVWAIDPENDRMTSIVQKITHDKSQILRDQIDFSIEVDPGLRSVILPGEFRYQICSICNESFNNISKYANASRVSVVISRENKNILLTVADNGKGFDPEAVKKNEITGSGYGLSNMHRRASRIGGSFRVVSAPGQGTKTEFRFPFKG